MQKELLSPPGDTILETIDKIGFWMARENDYRKELKKINPHS
jgi:hypothetical protein